MYIHEIAEKKAQGNIFLNWCALFRVRIKAPCIKAPRTEAHGQKPQETKAPKTRVRLGQVRLCLLGVLSLGLLSMGLLSVRLLSVGLSSGIPIIQNLQKTKFSVITWKQISKFPFQSKLIRKLVKILRCRKAHNIKTIDPKF